MGNLGILGAAAIAIAIVIGIFLGLTAAFGVVIALSVYFVIVCTLMILLILIQKPRGGGLSGAFGGAGGDTQSMFGAKVGDMLTWATVFFFVAFLVLAVMLTWEIRPEQEADDLTAIPPVTSTEQPAGTAPGAAETVIVEEPSAPADTTLPPISDPAPTE